MSDTRHLVGPALTERQLNLILFATETCNFRCTYCYEDFEHGPMTRPVLDGVKNLMSRRAPRLDDLTIAWFGGEPLLELPLIREVMSHARSLAGDHPGLEYSSSITSNGWLLARPVFEELLALGITTWQVTLDGPPEWHDRRRRLAGGGGTFRRIWENLEAIREAEGHFTIYIRLHVDEVNAPALPGLVEDYIAVFGGDDRFQPHFHPLIRGGKSPEEDVCPLSGKQGQKMLTRLAGHARDQGLNVVGDDEAPRVCYAATANSYIIRADGRIGKCSVALESPANQLGRINRDGTLDIDARSVLPWLRGMASGDEAALECPLYGIPPAPRSDEEMERMSAGFVNGLRSRLAREDSPTTTE